MCQSCSRGSRPRVFLFFEQKEGSPARDVIYGSCARKVLVKVTANAIAFVLLTVTCTEIDESPDTKKLFRE